MVGRPSRRWLEAGAPVALALAPGALLVALSFRSGGFFPDAPALAAAALLLVLVLRLTLIERPFAGQSVAYVAGAILLGLFALLTLVSSEWSGAHGRALVEYDRALLYLLAFLVFGAAGFSRQRLRWMARGLALGAFIVCLCALIQRLLPDVWQVAGEPSDERLNWPLTYWNALGMVASLGIVLCFSLTSDARELRTVRVLAAAAVPVLAATVLLTFSRGAMAAGIIGILVAIVAGRPSGLLSGLLTTVPAGAVAVVSAYRAELLASDALPDAATIAQGHDLALTVAVAAAGAAFARAVLTLLDARLLQLRRPAALTRRGVVPAAIAGAVLAAVAAALILGAPAEVERQYDRFVEGDRVASGSDVRSRLQQVGNNGRIDNWDVALQAYRSQPLRGRGAGTYALEWERRRPVPDQIEDGHSLYLEVLAELGIGGLILVTAAILLILGGLLARTRGPERGAAGALFAAAVMWAIHAGIDWDWEMPALTLWVFAAGGAALAATPSAGRRLPQTARILAALACLVVATVPARVFLSEVALRDSRRAFAARDCPTALDRALDASEALSARAEPFVIVGICDVRLGEPQLAVAALEKAVARDPDNWETHYVSALVRAAAGLDPRAAARKAHGLNPLEDMAAEAVERFDTDRPEVWRRRAAEARLPTE